MHLEAEIAARFNLRSCTISPFLSDRQDNEDLATLSVGQAAGQVLAQHIVLPSTKSVAIDPFGDTLAEAVRCIPQISKPDLKVWPTQGCLSRDFQSVTSPVLSVFELRTKADIGVLPVPYAPGSSSEYENFSALPSVQSALQSAAAANLVIGQIHPADVDDAVTPPNVASQAITGGAVSRFLGTYFDPAGDVVDSKESQIKLRISDFCGPDAAAARRLFALAAGAQRESATSSALNTGLITDLILDETLAGTLIA